jgi:hypothetical protein
MCLVLSQHRPRTVRMRWPAQRDGRGCIFIREGCTVFLFLNRMTEKKGNEQEHTPAPGSPSTTTIVTFSLSIMGLWAAGGCSASTNFSMSVHGPEERVVFRAGWWMQLSHTTCGDCAAKALLFVLIDDGGGPRRDVSRALRRALDQRHAVLHRLLRRTRV